MTKLVTRLAYFALLPDGYVRRVHTVWAEPDVRVERWRLIKVRHADGSVQRHVIGSADGEGRISTRLVAVEPITMSLTSASGRVYCLAGLPGHDMQAEKLYGCWLATCGRTELKDLSGALLRLRNIRLKHGGRPHGV